MIEEERELIITQLASRRREVKNSRTHRSPNPMSQLAVCGMCGATMRMHTDKGTPRLLCGRKREHTKGGPTGAPTLRSGLTDWWKEPWQLYWGIS